MTSRDVAQALGVSHTTVSNAYNRPDRLSPDLRRRVLETAAQLGYPGPDPLAAGLAVRRVGTLGVLFDEDLSYALTDPAALLFLQGVARAGQVAALGLTLLPADRTPAGIDAAGNAVRRALIDGLLVYSVSADHPGLLAALERGIPLVVVDEPEPPTEGAWPFLGVDDRGGAYAAARHLTELGHRRVAILADRLTPAAPAGVADPSRRAAATFHIARQRLDGYLAALAAAGTPPDTVAVWECGGGTPEHAVGPARALLSASPRPTAILAMTDELARGVLVTAAGLGLSVPRDLSVVGFDDVPEAARTNPPLTTVRQPLADKGALAVRLLQEPSDPPAYRRLDTQLVLRRTTASPAPVPG